MKTVPVTVPVSQDSKEYAKCKLGEFVHNNTKPLFRIAWHFLPNTKYLGEVSLIISVDIHRESRLTYPGHQRFFSRAAEIFGVGRGPKPRAAKPLFVRVTIKT